jgi:8-oxo-dGTP diphosphatase
MKTQIAVRALIMRDNKLLLVSNDGDLWYTPSGRLENIESLTDCLQREILEETGLDAEIGDVIYVSEFFDEGNDLKKIEIYFSASVSHELLTYDQVDVSGSVKFKKFMTQAQINSQNVYPTFIRNLLFNQRLNRSSIYQGFDIKEKSRLNLK